MIKYDDFLELIKNRRMIRRFKTDPIPDEYITKILDAAHYAPSGANSQPWEFIVVKDPEVKKRLFDAYIAHHEDAWHLEQQRQPECRIPALRTPADDKNKTVRWLDAPVVIVVLDDPRKHFMHSMHAHMVPADLRLGTSMGYMAVNIHLAALSLGLGAQQNSLNAFSQSRFREVLGYPDPLYAWELIAVGYRDYDPGPPRRWPLEELTHYDGYDMKKYLRYEDFLKYMAKVRKTQEPDWALVTK